MEIARVLLTLGITAATDTDALSFAGQWIDWNGSCDPGDYDGPALGSAFTRPVDQLVVEARQEFELEDTATHLNLAGLSSVRVGVSGSQPNGANEASFFGDLHPVYEPPVLWVTVCDPLLFPTPTPTDTPTETPTVTPTPDAVPPGPIADPGVSDLVPGEGITVSGSPGSVEGGATVRITNQRTGGFVEVIAAPDGSFTAPAIDALMDDMLSIVVIDPAGNQSSIVEVVAGPPDPTWVAPAIDRTVASTLIDTAAFLYDGPNPVQVGVTAEITPKQAAVIRGEVTDRQGEPAQGVKVPS
jgi:hypothetical protein